MDGEKVCSHQDVLNHLNLTRHNELYSLTRPVLDFRQPTNVTLDILLYAILEVVSGQINNLKKYLDIRYQQEIN